jgi:hypothetical protein
MTDYPKERITFSDMQKCCEREAKLRQKVYRRRVDEGKMTRDEAEHEIALMLACAAVFAKMALDFGERLL